MNNKQSAVTIRQKATKLLKEKKIKTSQKLSELDSLKLIHELEVHQIELELINEELKLANEKSELNSEKYTNLYNFATSGYYTLSKEGNISELNLQGAKILNKERSGLINSNFTFFVSNETKPVFIQFLEKLFSSDNKETCDVTIITNEKTETFVHISGIKSENSENCFITVIDITERKLIEKALRISENRFKQVTENAKEWVWEVDKNGLYTYVSPVVKEILGYDIDEIIGKKYFYDFFAPENKDKTKQMALEAFSRKEILRSFENSNISKDGREVILSTSGDPIVDSNGNLIGYRGVDIDITDHKKLLETYDFLLKCGLPGSGEDFFESLAKYLAKIMDMDYVCIDRLEGDNLNTQTIAIYNDGKIDQNVSYALKDTPCGDVVGKTICCFPENVCKLFPKDKDLQNLKAVSYIGTTLWSFDGNPIGLIAVIGQEPLKNVSFAETILKLVAVRAAAELERKQAELELINAKEKAEESDRLKSAFLANMSHEIRTPMNGILGFADLLKTPDLKGEKQQEYITIIEDSGKRMLNIINDIIDISKIESGLTEVKISHTNINEQIEYIYSFFKLEIEKKGLQIKCIKSLPISESNCYTDREKIYAILINLVKNAIKFTNEGYIEIGYNKKDKDILLYVKDTGTGISKEKTKIIFERFRQGSESHSRNYEGAGLGLSISKAYVKLLGGNIWVESEEGKGSTFYFTIPINTEQKIDNVIENKDIDVVDDKIIKDLKILIVEDDLTSEKLAKVNIENYCKNILIAKNGLEAVQICRNNADINLVLMDIKMPVMNGYEATKQIREFNKEVIIFAHTAYALSGEREIAIEAGCNDYISKPYNQASFNNLMQKYFT